MSLRGLVHGITSTLNPDTIGDVYLNTGPVTGYGGKRLPTYDLVLRQPLQVQRTGYGALRRAESLNIQGVMRQVYFQGYLAGVERLAGRGGDMLRFNGAYWLVVDVLEEWDTDGWVKVLVQQQVNPPENVTLKGIPVASQSAALVLMPVEN